MFGFAISILGIVWFSAAALYGSHLGDVMSFHMVLVIGHMVIGTIVAIVGINRM